MMYFLRFVQIPKNCNFPKQHPEYKFLDHRLLLHRSAKEISENTLMFKVSEHMSKPELKQYIEKLYNIKVEKVNTARFMGKVHRTMEGKPKAHKNYKKAFVMTNQKIPSILNQPI